VAVAVDDGGNVEVGALADEVIVDRPVVDRRPGKGALTDGLRLAIPSRSCTQQGEITPTRILS